MSSIVVVGGTGYAGSAIVSEAVRRGHDVTVVSRTEPASPVEGAEYVQRSAAEAAALVSDADVAVGALSPRGDNAGTLPDVYGTLASHAADHGTRLIVVGGFGSLRPAPDAPRFAEGDSMPPHVLPEAREMAAVLSDLQSSPDGLDWLFVSPAQQFGSHRTPGPVRGTYRVGGDVALFAEDGTSVIEVDDFALAVVDEIERPAHHRAHIGVAY